MQRRIARPLSMVLVRDWRTEQRHDAVASVLVHGALEAVHAFGEDRKEALQDRVPLLGIAVGEQFHRALEIRKQHGDLLALAFEGGLRLQDLVGEVFWSVGAWVALRSRDARERSDGRLLRRPHENIAL